MDIQDFLLPIGVPEFFSEYWERKPLLIQERGDFYWDSIFQLASVDKILTSSDLRQPAFRMVKDGLELASSDYTLNMKWGDSNFENAADVDRVLDHYRNGVTLVLQALHRNCSSVAELCKKLEKQFTHPVQANAYLTPRGSQGFKPHWDTHCVFIAQISGFKHWKLYENPFPLPCPSQKHHLFPYGPGACISEFELKPGDLLYIPRGYFHEGLTTDSHSLHLTIGVCCSTWVDLIGDLMGGIKNVQQLRSSLPAGFVQNGIPDDKLEGLREIILDYVRSADLGKLVFESAKKFIVQSRSLRTGDLLAIDLSKSQDCEQQYVIRSSLIYFTSNDEDGNIVLHFEGKTVQFPAFCESALKILTSSACSYVTVKSIAGELNEDEACILLTRLYEEGFLRILDNTAQ